jgi:4'-phosphopantetheinyl transferase
MREPCIILAVSARNLAQNEVHLWSVSLDSHFCETGRLIKLLSTPELERADRFLQTLKRDRFIRSRAALRTILGKYLELQPAEVLFNYNENQKPQVLNSRQGKQVKIHFNLSHSGAWALIGVTLAPRRIGVDLEEIRKFPRSKQFLKKYGTQKEQQEFKSLHSKEVQTALFRFWTQKEALIKAFGRGLGSIRLDHLDISLLPQTPPTLRQLPEGLGHISNWLIRNGVTPLVEQNSPYASCVVTELFEPNEELHFKNYSFAFNKNGLE